MPDIHDPDLPYMQKLVELARENLSGIDIPIAAYIVDPTGKIIATALNQREISGDPTAHAEIVAIREAAKVFGEGWRLTGCTLYVTIEPCTMCAGAISLSRIERVVFGARELKTGAVGSLWDVLQDPRVTWRPTVRSHLMEEETSSIMRDYFAALRKTKSLKKSQGLF